MYPIMFLFLLRHILGGFCIRTCPNCAAMKIQVARVVLNYDHIGMQGQRGIAGSHIGSLCSYVTGRSIQISTVTAAVDIPCKSVG